MPPNIGSKAFPGKYPELCISIQKESMMNVANSIPAIPSILFKERQVLPILAQVLSGLGIHIFAP